MTATIAMATAQTVIRTIPKTVVPDIHASVACPPKMGHEGTYVRYSLPPPQVWESALRRRQTEPSRLGMSTCSPKQRRVRRQRVRKTPRNPGERVRSPGSGVSPIHILVAAAHAVTETIQRRPLGERQLAAADCKPGHGAMATSLGVQCFARASDSRTAVPPTRSHVSKAPPRPVAPPCSFCEDAVWRFNGRSWYASDRVSKRRHICAAPEAVAHPQSMRSGANGQRPLPAVYGQPQERAGVTAKIVLAALAALAGIYAVRAMRR